jgi:hypothetical protein
LCVIIAIDNDDDDDDDDDFGFSMEVLEQDVPFIKIRICKH